MKYEPKPYMRLGAITGGIIGVIIMMITVCIGKTVVGAVLLFVCLCLGIICGCVMERKHRSIERN